MLGTSCLPVRFSTRRVIQHFHLPVLDLSQSLHCLNYINVWMEKIMSFTGNEIINCMIALAYLWKGTTQYKSSSRVQWPTHTMTPCSTRGPVEKTNPRTGHQNQQPEQEGSHVAIWTTSQMMLCSSHHFHFKAGISMALNTHYHIQLAEPMSTLNFY